MIVENNSLMRQEIIQSVAKTEDIVMECADAESALEQCGDFNPDWILLDIRLEKTSGLMAAEKITAMKLETNIAFVTSYDLDMYRKAAKRLGINHYFLKNDLLAIRDTIHKK